MLCIHNQPIEQLVQAVCTIWKMETVDQAVIHNATRFVASKSLLASSLKPSKIADLCGKLRLKTALCSAS